MRSIRAYIVAGMTSFSLSPVTLIAQSDVTAFKRARHLDYDVAIGGFPMVVMTTERQGGGLSFDWENLVEPPYAFYLRSTFFTTERRGDVSRNEPRQETSLQFEPGLRYYFNPFSSSWIISGSFSLWAEHERRNAYRISEGVDINAYGGHRWLEKNGYFVSLNAGTTFTLYKRFDQKDGTGSRSETWTKPRLALLATVGRVL